MSDSKKLKVFFYMTDLIGPQNACIGLGQELLKRGHKVCFLANEKFGDKFVKYGFVQHKLRSPSTATTDKNADPIKEITDKLIEVGFFSNSTPLEKVKMMNQMDFMPDLYKQAADFEPQIQQLIQSEAPDLIVVDSEVMPPCLINANIPFVYLFCSNPVGFFDSDQLPPFLSDFPTNSDPSLWAEFKETLKECFFDQIVSLQRKLATQFGHPFDERQKFVVHSPYLNLYQFPEELDYHDVIDIPENYFRVDAFCREETGTFVLPENFRKRMKPGQKLIYLSMGSMGSCDVKLMKRLVSILGKTEHCYIVSKGLLHDQYELADNMWGEAYVPQTQVLPLVDLVITHGGNNTLTETISFGKPMIVMPLFYDQLNNGQRVQEKGFGVKLDVYRFTEQQLLDAIDQLLNDRTLQQKMETISKRIKQSQSKQLACIKMEQLALKHQG